MTGALLVSQTTEFVICIFIIASNMLHQYIITVTAHSHNYLEEADQMHAKAHGSTLIIIWYNYLRDLGTTTPDKQLGPDTTSSQLGLDYFIYI